MFSPLSPCPLPHSQMKVSFILLKNSILLKIFKSCIGVPVKNVATIIKLPVFCAINTQMGVLSFPAHLFIFKAIK